MGLIGISLVVILIFLIHGMSLLPQAPLHAIPYGMAEFGPFRDENLRKLMSLSKKLTQMQRLSMSEKCRPFRHKCKMAEQCCSLQCLKVIQRCNA